MSWGWWLPKYGKEKIERAFNEIPFDEVFNELEQARANVEKAINNLIRKDVSETHRYISEAHQNLRRAARLLGYSPR